jgi:hypothetical protein
VNIRPREGLVGQSSELVPRRAKSASVRRRPLQVSLAPRNLALFKCVTEWVTIGTGATRQSATGELRLKARGHSFEPKRVLAVGEHRWLTTGVDEDDRVFR